MSASPAPGGGAPKTGPKPPATSAFRGLGRYAVLAGAAIGLTYTYYATRAPNQPVAPSVNPLRSQGVQNIEKAYTNGGATPSYTPAYGGTKLGDKSATHLKEGSATGTPKGMDEDKVGDEQRPVQPTKVGEVWNDMQYGSKSRR